eukprot:CAMPEP_0202900338 /NCGR_PEP_ID=MMETSP1392-20130828/11160_1 /ASSEMBLY_ACC=CAM_ASM_000868 /TAXON_ID=225041 /ORGANISM="Chlamydomonas chlamydogama, Strain SAG 11-48b" /LENGTH=242 /DNA_ID=CAMNT_0049586709 /DNA_START=81 /DNA_END=809 /DNA_ORIENTATION=+
MAVAGRQGCLALEAASMQSKSSGSKLMAAASSARDFLMQPHALAVSRNFGTSSPALSNLVNILNDEIKHEKDNYIQPEPIKSGPPAPFVLSESLDDTLLSLKRTYKGEEIHIDLHVNNQPSPEYTDDDSGAEDGNEEVLTTVVFNVTVTKEAKALVFECESDGTFVAINHVSHEPKDGHVSESFYTGPVFEELDENLQNEFRSYLQERGITEDLGEYLRHLIYDKEQKEYVGWLQKVRDFVK